MKRIRQGSMVLLAAALAAGTVADRAPVRPPITLGGYRVLAADLHVHPFPLSGSPLAPWDLAIEARHQGLDAIAIAGQNEAWTGRTGRWFATRFGGPIVLASEEIHGPRFHVVAAGIHETISWRLPARRAIEEIHRQGGVAIAAHPVASTWPAYDEAGAIDALDGTEVLQPTAYIRPQLARELVEFYGRAHAAAIASSDYHGMGPVGLCRTYLFVREVSQEGILEAIRSHRTVVVGGSEVYGDPALTKFAGDLPAAPQSDSGLSRASRACGFAGLLGLVLASRRRA